MILNDFSTRCKNSFFWELNRIIHDSERQKTKIIIEGSVFSLTKKAGTLFQQTQTKAQKTSHNILRKLKKFPAFDLFYSYKTVDGCLLLLEKSNSVFDRMTEILGLNFLKVMRKRRYITPETI